MPTINIAEDVCPVSEFRADINQKLKHAAEKRRPILLTQHGKSAAVVLDVKTYQALLYERDLFEDVRIAEEQIGRGDTYSTTEVKNLLKKRYGVVKG